MTRAIAPARRATLPDLRAVATQARARWTALGLRQQLLVLAATAVAVLGGLDVLWLGPRDAALRTLRAQVESAERSAAEDAERANRLRAEQARLRAEEQALRARLAAAEAALVEARRGLVGPATLRERVRSLTQDGAVRLVALTTTPPEAVALTASGLPAPGPGPAAPAPGGTAPGTGLLPPADATAPVLYRWGVQVTVEGRFEDLRAYLARLEASELGLRWSSVTLDNRTWPQVRMELRLFMLGDQPTWRGTP